MSDPIAALRAVSGSDLSSGATDLPNIPQVPASADPALVNILSVMKSWMEKAAGSGATGFASKQELISAGLISTDSTGNVVGQVDMRVPPVPTGLVANGAMTNILVQWTTPVGKYANHGYTEVWAAEIDDFSQAVMVGQAGGFVFSHAVGEDSTRFYWIRFVSTAGVKGPYNAVGGTQGNTAQNVNYLIDSLTEVYGTNGAAPFFQVDTEIVVNGVTIPPGIYIKDAFIADGTITTAQIKNATIDSAQITGKLTASQINADQLAVTNGSFSGQLIGASGTFSGNLQAASGTFMGELVAATGTFSGSLSAGTVDISKLVGYTETRSGAGSYQFTVQNDQTNIRYQLLAGGGGGGVGDYGEWNTRAGGGGGGGAGQYLIGTAGPFAAGTIIRLVNGHAGAAGLEWQQNGGDGGATYLQYSNDNGNTFTTFVYADYGRGGRCAPDAYYDNADGDWAGGDGGFGYPSGENPGGGDNWQGSPNTDRGGNGASSIWGAGGAGVHNGGGNPATGYGAGGAGGGFHWGWRNNSWHNSGKYNGWYPGAAGSPGKGILEFFNPNAVVLKTQYNELETRVISLEQRVTALGG